MESDTTKQDVTDQKKFFQFHGESYHSFLECCKLHGVSYDAVRNYQKYHEITKEEALEHYISMDKAFLFRNVIYDDFFSCCKAYDISPNTVIYHEKNRKISRAEALEYVLSLRKKRSFPYQGKVFCTKLLYGTGDKEKQCIFQGKTTELFPAGSCCLPCACISGYFRMIENMTERTKDMLRKKKHQKNYCYPLKKFVS